MTFPAWLNYDAWAGFVEMRKRIKAPLTNRAMTLTLNELGRLKDQGYDPNACLDQSTQRSWRGVFQTHDKPPAIVHPQQEPSPKATEVREKLDEYYRRKGSRDYLRDENGRPYLQSPTSGQRVYMDGRAN